MNNFYLSYKTFKLMKYAVAGVLLPFLFINQAYTQFSDLADGPYKKLIIQNVMVIPGHGGPPVGPYDITIAGNTITEMTSFDPVTAGRRGETARTQGDRIIDGKGKYVMPGMIDLHMHLRKEPMEIEYVYYLKLAHGVTSLVPAADRGLDAGMEQAKLCQENKILAPRLFPIWGWGRGTDYTQTELDNPANASKIAREMVAKGAHVVSVGNLGWSQALFGAVCKAVYANGGITQPCTCRHQLMLWFTPWMQLVSV